MRRFVWTLFFACLACGGQTGSGGSGDASTGGFGLTGGTGGVVVVTGGGGGGNGGTGGVVFDAGCLPLTPNEQLGTYHLALATTLAPTKPILYRAEVSVVVSPGGLASLSLQAEPLDAQDRITPVGPTVTLISAPTGNGTLHFGPVNLLIPGAANPITGSDIEADIALDGSICGSSPFYCGDMLGNVTKPIVLDLTGSTFTLETQASPTIHVNCQMSVADPAPV